MEEQESSNDILGTAEKDLYYALTQVDLQRAHITLKIEDFDCITEERRYIFYNKGNQEISTIPLPARKRKIQRNMKVEDSSKRNVVFIPSSSSTDIFVKTATHILAKSNEYLTESQEEDFKRIKDVIQRNLTEIFKYRPDPKTIESVCENMHVMLEMETLKIKEFIREISPLIEILEQYNGGLYYPLVALPESLRPHKYLLITLSVERLREYLRDKWERFKTFAQFGLWGTFTFSSEPGLHPKISNHVKIFAPEGLLIRDVEFEFDTTEQPQIPEEKNLFENWRRSKN